MYSRELIYCCIVLDNVRSTAWNWLNWATWPILDPFCDSSNELMDSDVVCQGGECDI